MINRLLVDAVLVAHFGFLAFVVCGGLLVRRWPRLLVPHLLAVAWGVYVEAMPGVLCPLTGLENDLAVRAGESGYQGSFIEHYLAPIIYPDGLTPALQRTIAVLVVVANVTVYAWPRRRRSAPHAVAAEPQR